MTAESGIFVPLIIALVEFAKRMGMPTKFAPLLAVVLGLVSSLYKGVIMFDTIVAGLVIGLASAGLYTVGVKPIIKKK